jgi:23S rRNA (uracil1939-C5)-methyltransferase
MNSHEVLGVEQCPISSPLINRAIQTVWQLGREQLVSHAVIEMEFFANADDSSLLVELTLPDQYWKRRSEPTLPDFVTALRRALPEVAGVSAFRQTKQGMVREKVPGDLRDIFGDNQLIYQTGGRNYPVSAGSFFQTNRHLADTLVRLVTGNRSGDRALDLYAGAGLFTLPLAESFREVEAVEAAPFSFGDLKHNIPANGKAHREMTADFLARYSGVGADLVVVDPPRAGLGEAVTTRLAALQPKRLTYVSCDPATLARDLRALLAAGFRPESMDLIDLFPQTFHIESVTQLVR